MVVSAKHRLVRRFLADNGAALPTGLRDQDLVGLQFGGLISAIGDVAETVGAPVARGLQRTTQAISRVPVLGPALGGVGRYMDWETRTIGRPLASALLTPLKPILPDDIQNGLVTFGAAFLTPSSAAFFLIPFGRAFTAARLVGKEGALVLGGAQSARQAAMISRATIRELWAPPSRAAARVMVANDTGTKLPELIAQLSRVPADDPLAKLVLEAQTGAREVRKMTPSYWAKLTNAEADEKSKLVEKLLFGGDVPADIRKAPGFFQGRDWYNNLMRGEIIDPWEASHQGLFARTWSATKAIPGIGPALEGLTKPIAEVAQQVTRPLALISAPVRRSWLHASSFVTGWNWESRVVGGQISLLAESAFGKEALKGGTTGIKYLGAAARVEANPAVAKVIGTLPDIFEHPELYELTAHQTWAIGKVQRLFDLDRASAVALGVPVGQVNGGYIPHRINIEAMSPKQAAKLGDFFSSQSASPRYAAAFHRRRYVWDDFVQKAEEISDLARAKGFTITGSGVETDFKRLVDWRLGHAARKKAEQAFLTTLARNPETADLVGRKVLTYRGRYVSQEAAEELLLRGVPGEQILETVMSIPKTAARRVAETRLGRSLTLHSPTTFSGTTREMGFEARDLLEGAVRREPGVEGVLSRGIDYMRSVLLSADLSPIGMVQGIRTFSADPVAYLSQFGEAAAWMTTPRGKQLWALQNMPNVRHWTNSGLTLGNVLDIRPDLLQGLNVSLAGKSVKTPLWPIGWANSQMMDMIQVAKLQSANTMLSAMTLAQTSKGTASLLSSLPWFDRAKKQVGPEWRAAKMDRMSRAIADGLNNAIGPQDFRLSFTRGRPSPLEKMLILTPSWTRGNIGQIVNALGRPDETGLVARWLLMNQLAVGALAASKISMAFTGEMPNFDPRANDFLSAKLPWGRFNVMPAMPLYRLPVRLIVGRPGEADALTTRFQDFMRLGETRMGQIPRIIVDLTAGQDFLGRKIDDKGQYLLKELLPVVGQEFAESSREDISLKEMSQRMLLQFTGATTIPKTPFQLEKDRVEQLTGKPYDEVPVAELRRLRATDGALQRLQERKRHYRSERGGALNQFFSILADNSQKAKDAVDTFLTNTPPTQPGRMAMFARVSEDELGTRAEAAEAAQDALGIDDKDISRGPTKVLQDTLAIRYWTVRPELEQCRISDDPEGCEDEAWRSFRAQRQEVLDEAPNDAVRKYIIEEWTATRYAGNPEAEDLERRRVLAQLASSEFFEASPYVMPDGTEMPRDMLDALFTIRRDVSSLLLQTGRIVRGAADSEDVKMPPGLRRAVLTQMLQQEKDPTRRAAIAFDLLWNNQKLQPFLRNPRRDDILVQTPDMIKFKPDIFGRFLRRAAIFDRLGDDPEIVAIAAAQGTP